MKKYSRALALALVLVAFGGGQSGCTTAPSERVAVVQTLKVAGQAAEAAVELSARLFQSGVINDEQARRVIDFYNQRFQPAFKLAVTTAQGDLSSYSSPALWAILIELSGIVNSYTTPKTS